MSRGTEGKLCAWKRVSYLKVRSQVMWVLSAMIRKFILGVTRSHWRLSAGEPYLVIVEKYSLSGKKDSYT